VVIPCYNDGRTIVDTVRSTIGQDQCEVIIVNDGSEDAHTIRKLRTLEDEGYAVISRRNGGVGAALTTGALAASAPYIFPLGADDLLLEGSLGRLADHLDGKPDLALVWGDFLMFGDYDKYGLSAPSLDPWEITYTNDVPGLVLIRRDVLLTVGGWQLRNAPDWDLAMALAERGFAGERLPIAVFRYRRHGQRTGNDTIDRYPEVVRLLRSRHPDLFRDRRQHARFSRVPRAVRLAVDGVDRLPGLGVSRRAGVIGGIIHGHRRLVMGPEVAPIARSARMGIPSLGSRLAEVARQKVTHPTRRRI
jgi:glycosyltransferase involved in cell wall biosynthesis